VLVLLGRNEDLPEYGFGRGQQKFGFDNSGYGTQNSAKNSVFSSCNAEVAMKLTR
jgi:hypothetical protein